MSSAPRRWKDSPDAPIGMRELLGSARPTRPLDEGTFRRNAARVAKLSVAPAAAAATISIWAKLAAAGAIGLAATGAVVAVELRDMQPAPPVATVAPTQPAQAAPLVTTNAPAKVAEPESTATEPPPPSAPARALVSVPARASAPAAPAPTVDENPPPAIATTSPKTSTLASELLLLEDARAYASRDASIALARLAEHRQRYPSGVLAAERDLMELDLLRRMGRVQDARDRANAWLARDPNGMHSARVREILASLGP